MKKIYFVFLMLFSLSNFYGQELSNTIDYIVVVKEGYNLDYTSKVQRNNEYFNFEISDPNLKNFINSLPIFEIRKELPTAKTPYLLRVYRITTNSDLLLDSFMNRDEIEDAHIYIEPELLHLPDDYTAYDEDRINTALELIRAPMAWGITKGDPNILVGIVDSNFELQHDDMVGKYQITSVPNPNGGVFNANQSTTVIDEYGSHNHGTTVAGMFATTNNSLGTASIAPNIKLAVLSNFSYERLLVLSQQQGVRVVNASWGHSAANGNTVHQNIISQIINGDEDTPPVVVVAAGGNRVKGANLAFWDWENGVYTRKFWPASYDGVINVGSINHWQYRNTAHPNPSIGTRFWEDVYSSNPLDYSAATTAVIYDRIDILAPGVRVLGPGADHSDENSVFNSYHRHSGSSIASPITAGVVALMLSVNPDLTPAEVKQIIKTTGDDISQIPENAGFPVLQNIRRLNAFRAVTAAKCLTEDVTTHKVDLLIRDNDGDYGQEPNISTDNLWRSPEIWIRNQADGKRIRDHQNPTYASANNTNYIYVRVYNRGCLPSSGNDLLKVYWSKASTSLAWPLHWEGNGYFPNNGPLLGAPVGDVIIPVLQPGEDTIVEVPWDVPSPSIYEGINAEPWHFCLLARIISDDDPIAVAETAHLAANVGKNNNIAWKNVTVINIPEEESNERSSLSGVISVANLEEEITDYAIEIVVDNLTNDYVKKLYKESEITLELDGVLYDQWINSGQEMEHLEILRGNVLKVTNEASKISRISLLPNQMGTINFRFNFLTKEITDKKGRFTLHVYKRNLATNEVIGGETYEIIKNPRTPFTANAGNDRMVDKNETVTLNAQLINKDAVYNWYDEEGQLIYSGTDLEIVADISKKFKLEIISLEDGLKDYSEVSVEFKNNRIVSYYPNPTNNILNVQYKANYPENSYFLVTGLDPHNNQTVHNYVINPNSDTLTIDVSTFTNGYYLLSFIHDGSATDSKIFIKN